MLSVLVWLLGLGQETRGICMSGLLVWIDLKKGSKDFVVVTGKV